MALDDVIVYYNSGEEEPVICPNVKAHTGIDLENVRKDKYSFETELLRGKLLLLANIGSVNNRKCS
jgi:hypothetical protein